MEIAVIRRAFLNACQIPWLLFGVLSTEPAIADGPIAAASPHQPIVAENRHSGATDWQLTRVRADSEGFRSVQIEGYCSNQSVKAGETIDIMISTNPPCRFELEIFRMGYYGGRGAAPDEAAGSV